MPASRLLRVLASVTLAAAVAAPAASAQDFSWRGGPQSGAKWSTPNNWTGNVAPSGTVGTISFPFTGICQRCEAANDIAGLTAASLVLAYGGGVPTGDEPLTLTSGLTVTDGGSNGSAYIKQSLPLVLGAPNAWTVTNTGFQLANRVDGSGVPVGHPGGVSGTQSLDVALHGNIALLALGGTDSEVGAATITGDAGTSPGASYDNALLDLSSSSFSSQTPNGIATASETRGSLNGTNGNGVALKRIRLRGAGEAGGADDGHGEHRGRPASGPRRSRRREREARRGLARHVLPQRQHDRKRAPRVDGSCRPRRRGGDLEHPPERDGHRRDLPEPLTGDDLHARGVLRPGHRDPDAPS